MAWDWQDVTLRRALHLSSQHIACSISLSLAQGRHASVDEITACALNAIELDKKHGDEAVQVRVTMGKEPTHFLAIFKGKLVIYEVTWLCARRQQKMQAPAMAWQLQWK